MLAEAASVWSAETGPVGGVKEITFFKGDVAAEERSGAGDAMTWLENSSWICCGLPGDMIGSDATTASGGSLMWFTAACSMSFPVRGEMMASGEVMAGGTGRIELTALMILSVSETGEERWKASPSSRVVSDSSPDPKMSWTPEGRLVSWTWFGGDFSFSGDTEKEKRE